MEPKSPTFLCLLVFSVLLSSSNAVNITKVLSAYPEYGKMNDLLTQTKIVDLCTNRQTITILALNNATISSIEGRPQDEIKRILMDHIVLDYYDSLKIQKLGKKSVTLTTLYQTTGVAQDQQGFLNLTKLSPDDVVFGSAIKGSPLVAKLLGTVFTQPFNISVLRVSTPIVAPGFGDPVLPPPPPPALPPPPADAPAPETADGDDDAESPDAAAAPTPGPATAADVPAKAKSPPSPDEADADAPNSGSTRVASSSGVAAVLSLVAALVVA